VKHFISYKLLDKNILLIEGSYAKTTLWQEAKTRNAE